MKLKTLFLFMLGVCAVFSVFPDDSEVAIGGWTGGFKNNSVYFFSEARY